MIQKIIRISDLISQFRTSMESLTCDDGGFKFAFESGNDITVYLKSEKFFRYFKDGFSENRSDFNFTKYEYKINGILFYTLVDKPQPITDIEELHHAALRMQKIILSDGTIISAKYFMDKDGWIIQAQLNSDKVFIYDPQYIDFEGREVSDNG